MASLRAAAQALLLLPVRMRAEGDELCLADDAAPRRCCRLYPRQENASCWRSLPKIEGMREFHPRRCCRDSLSEASLEYGRELRLGEVLERVGPSTTGIVTLRAIPGLAHLLQDASAAWHDLRAWPNETAARVSKSEHLQLKRRVRAADLALSSLLWPAVQWLLSALARDLSSEENAGGAHLSALLRTELQGHIRHFEYLRADWAPRWGSLFPLHSDTFWLSIQTCPTIAGKPFEDGTFAIDGAGRMHRIRLSCDDIAVWFGDALEHLTGGRVRAARHAVLMHHSYRRQLSSCTACDASGPRRVTMFHLYPHSRSKDALLVAAEAPAKSPATLPQWQCWSERFDSWRSLRSNVLMKS
eukprot:TRINITY_DN39307_c0_g1_i1.p1 TRINITY_DN39307_c0_g1~~TRINITY_DN39307_c0_g1_i1.p1  ORF type:complete len:357 (+),score=38.95 TRINITY_DN39307_c0_g1_i1:203-1273(+)